MASHEGSRKRFKISRTESKPTCSNMPSTMATPAAAKDVGNSTVVEKKANCQHEQALKGLHTDIDAMRSLVTCKICDRFLYEPYALSCGHTYCYSCLREWLVTGHKKTCPDCRAVVTQKPNPNYIIRELVLVFVSRRELLADGETSEEHHKIAKEEGEIVAKDKANVDPVEGGLFKGRFDRTRRPILLPIRDPGDNVDRCPQCHWELEEDFCGHCGIHIDGEDHGFSDYDDDSDVTDDELDHEVDLHDVDAFLGADGQDDYTEESESVYTNDPNFGMLHRGTSPDYRHRRRPEFDDLHSLIVSDEEASEDENDNEALHGFVVGDGDVQYVSSDDGEETDVPAPTHRHRLSRRRPTVVISDNEEENAASTGAAAEAEQDSEDELPVVRGSRRPKRDGGRNLAGLNGGRHRRLQTIPSDEESSSGDGDDSDDNLEDHSDAAATAGFSPLDESRRPLGDGFSERSDYDSGSEAPSSMHPTFDNDDEGDEESNGSDDDDDDDDDDGWGTQADETPRGRRYSTHAPSHRLHTLGQHINPPLSARDIRSAAPASPTLRRSQAHPNIGRTTHRTQSPPNRGFLGSHDPRLHDPRLQSLQGHNILLPGPRPQSFNTHASTYPFQLDNTLVNINYNQRHQQMRTQPGRHAVSGGSSQSSTAGGVDVRAASSGGSSNTIGATTAARRKRALSIASDESIE